MTTVPNLTTATAYGCQFATDADILQMPVLDAERSNPLQRICDEGGCANIIVAMLAAACHFRAAEAAPDMDLEQLLSCQWQSVVNVLRNASTSWFSIWSWRFLGGA
uniref:DM8 domain-containing protein n=1 Tax=Nelumbo nucifera TaxID=4432 RepID=A0A822YC79_NELNU|nr:TPA_asm: hypothetical protein HUJ06_031370 [Nelumbo nucifera]